MAAQSLAVVEGDPSFWRVDTRTPAHQLAAGVAADATNKRFDDGRARPRYPVNRQSWGETGVNLIGALNWNAQGYNLPSYMTVNNLVVGQAYLLFWNTVASLSLGQNNVGPGFIPAQVVSAATPQPYEFIATATTYYLWTIAPPPNPLPAPLLLRLPNPCGFTRFNDPLGLDTLVYLTDDWRDGAGEDGGRGRAWRISSGNAPQSIPLNGQDLYGTSRLIPCFNSLVLLRQQNERHYFSAAAVVNNVITLNCAPAWDTGDQVFFWFDTSVQSALVGGALPPAPDSYAFVKNLANNQVELYSDSGMLHQYTFASALGRFYLERAALNPGFYGNGAPPLIAQPSANQQSLWQVGFLAVPVHLYVTGIQQGSSVWVVPNHRFVPGDAVVLANMPGGDTPANGTYYAWPLDGNHLQLFDTAPHAQQAANGSVAGLEAISNDPAINNAATMTKGGASALPMPPAREGYYTESQRLVLVSGPCNISISDPNDPLHYTPYQGSLTANLGESDPVVFVSSIASSDTLIFGKQNSILALYNLSQGPANWLLQSVTREYGALAPLSARPWGSSLMFMSRRGLDRVIYTAFGVIVGVPKPVSFDMLKYVNQVDWNNAAQSVVHTWDNRLFWAFPQQGQAGPASNNLVLSLNFLNSEPEKDVFGWEGAWTGSALQVYSFARHVVYGDERLCFADYAGNINWLGEGWLDLGLLPIGDRLTTRRYSGGDKQRKKWLKGLLTWETNNATLTVTAVAPGVNERYPLLTAFTYDRTQYLDGSGAVYNPATQQPPFITPFREDYSLAGPGEIIGNPLDQQQNINETVRMRIDDWGVQFIIANATGSCALVAVEVEGMRGPKAATRNV